MALDELNSAFDGLRVVDLSDRLSGAYAARMFGDYGADVVLGEPADGHPLRHEPPFLDDEPGIERSLLHAYANWNKRSVVISDDAHLEQLVATADVVVTTAARLSPRLSESVERAISASAIHLSVTPHGLTGPLAKTPGNNLTASARTGWSQINRYVEEAPLQLPVRQTGYIAGVAGFVGAAAALLRRERVGIGECVDVSEIEAVASTCVPWAILGLFIGGDNRMRYGPNGPRDRHRHGPLWKTRDGLINYGYGDWAKWAEAMRTLGLEELAEDPRYAPVLGRHQQDPAPIRQALADASASRKRWDLFHGLAKARCIAGVMQDSADLLDSDQLGAREFFVQTDIDGSVAQAPGPPAKLSATPWRLARPAPKLGADSNQVAREAPIRRAGVQHTSNPRDSRPLEQPLAGIRVLAFTQAWSGTFGTELLALMGADVIQIEARHRPDVWRGAGAPVPPGVLDPTREQNPLNTNGMFNSVNLNKRGVTLDMTHPRGKEIFWRMVPAFDIVADNFSPHVMTNWGITLETLQHKRKDIILASISGYGRTGPLADYPANGATTEPMAGFASIHGYAGDAAMNTGGLIPDPISGYYFAAAVLTALFHRERSGVGQRIDESMLEAVAVQLGDAVLERDANGVTRRPQGNKHPRIAPHGVYATVNDEWIAIAAETEDAWQALVRHMGMAELVSDPRFASSTTRKHNEAALDEILSHWCRGQDAVQLETDLGERGISAARAAPFLDVYQNPAAQLRERGYMAEVEHPESGCHLMPAAPIIFARTGRPSLRPSPCFGEHSREVFAAELGMTDTEYDELEALGITGTDRL